MNYYIDAHCHVFNKDILTPKILVQVLKSLIYSITHKQSSSASDQHGDLIDKIKHIINFLKVGFSDNSITVFETMEKSYNNSFLATPLMFDLEYCFSGSMKVSALDLLKTNLETNEMVFGLIELKIQEAEAEEKRLRTVSALKNNPKLLSTKSQSVSLFAELRQIIEQFRQHVAKPKPKSSFDIQLDLIDDLQKAYPEQVFPFFVVDPRRPGITEMVKAKVSKTGPFYGVKLYAPNGYSPTDPILTQKGGVYEFCIENDIPLTAHCSHGGFATFMNKIEVQGVIMQNGQLVDLTSPTEITFDVDFLKEGWVEDRAETLNDPLLWRKVLEAFNGLKLNLAHFGNWDESTKWTDEIFSMLTDFPSLRTDFSCVTDKDQLQMYHDNYFLKATPDVRKRFLYGSDFFLNLVFIDSFDLYVQQFHEVFTDDEFFEIAVENSNAFLSVEAISEKLMQRNEINSEIV